MYIDGYKRKGRKKMTEMIQKFRSYQLPPHQLDQLGLTKDWPKKIPASYVGRVYNHAERLRKVLRELSKH